MSRSTQDIQRPGAAATRNPLNDRETLVFYRASDGQIELERHQDPQNRSNFSGGVDDEPTFYGPAGPGNKFRWCPPPPPPPGETVHPFIQNPGQFAAMRYNDLSAVYGIRVDGIISQMSPAKEGFHDTKTADSALAACGDQRLQGWLYYASDPADTNGQTVLTEFDIPNRTASFDLNPRTAIEPTYLAAYFDPALREGTRCCIFQEPCVNPNEGARLNTYEMSANGNTPSWSQIPNTNNAQPRTPMAVVFMQGNVYLYFLQRGSNNLVRAQRRSGGQWSMQTPGIQMTINQNLQLTAVALPNGTSIRLFQERPNSGTSGARFRVWEDRI